MSFMKWAQETCTYMNDSTKWVGGFTPKNWSSVEIPTVTNCTNITDPNCCQTDLCDLYTMVGTKCYACVKKEFAALANYRIPSNN